MTNTQKASIAIAGIVLALTAFLIGKSLSKNVVQIVPIQNNTTNTTTPSTNTQKKNIFDLANEYKPYSVGDSREFKKVNTEDTDLSVGLGAIHDITSIFDEQNKVNYRLFRVGYDDAPPTYYAGRIIVEVTASTGGPMEWSYFVTEIADLNYLGKTEMQGNSLTVTCDPINNSPACTYSIQYHKDTSKLSVKKLK